MTKQEFTNRAIISMCANPNFCDGVTIDKTNIIEQADLLAKRLEEEYYQPFDEEA